MSDVCSLHDSLMVGNGECYKNGKYYNFIPPVIFVLQTIFGRLMWVWVKKEKNRDIKHGFQINNKCINKTWLWKDEKRNQIEVMNSPIQFPVCIAEVLACLLSIGVKENLCYHSKSQMEKSKSFSNITPPVIIDGVRVSQQK